MAEVSYTLCTLTASVCAWLLLRAYLRSRYKLLLWGGLCFVGLTLNNAMLVMDKLLFPEVTFLAWRLILALLSMLVLLYGIIWDKD